MTARLYVMPIVGDGASFMTRRRAKWADDVRAAGGGWAMIDYGTEPVCIVQIETNDAQHATIAADSAVRQVPANLDATLTAGNVTNVGNFLEALWIPAQWLNTSRTWRTTVRVVGGVFQLNQRWNGIAVQRNAPQRTIFADGRDFSRTVGSLPQAARDDLQTLFADLGLDASGVTGSTSLRQLLAGAGLQFAARPMNLLGAI